MNSTFTGLYGINVRAQLKAMGLLPDAVGVGRSKHATLAMREYRPQKGSEMEALSRLKVPHSNSSGDNRFRRLVLRYLATIHELEKRPHRKNRSSRSRDLRRQIKRVHTAIRRLVEGENGLVKSQDGIPRIPSCHLAEAVRWLDSYLGSLETHAELLRANAAHQQFRHAVSPQNFEILELVAFVHQVTGEPHWKNLAILLKGATGDAGMNGKRLFQLYKDRENSGQKRTLGVFRRARLQVAAGKLRLP